MRDEDKIMREKMLATISECKSKTPFFETSYNFTVNDDGTSTVDNPECLNELFDTLRNEVNKHCHFKDDAEIDVDGLTRLLIEEIDFDKDNNVQKHAFGYTGLTSDHNVYIACRLKPPFPNCYGESPKKIYKSMIYVEAKAMGKTNEEGKYISGAIRITASKVSIQKLNDKIMGKEKKNIDR